MLNAEAEIGPGAGSNAGVCKSIPWRKRRARRKRTLQPRLAILVPEVDASICARSRKGAVALGTQSISQSYRIKLSKTATNLMESDSIDSVHERLIFLGRRLFASMTFERKVV